MPSDNYMSSNMWYRGSDREPLPEHHRTLAGDNPTTPDPTNDRRRAMPTSAYEVLDAVGGPAPEETGQAPTVGDIADVMRDDQPRASRVVAAAVDAGLIRRLADPADGRRSLLATTASSQQRRRSNARSALRPVRTRNLRLDLPRTDTLSPASWSGSSTDSILLDCWSSEGPDSAEPLEVGASLIPVSPAATGSSSSTPLDDKGSIGIRVTVQRSTAPTSSRSTGTARSPPRSNRTCADPAFGDAAGAVRATVASGAFGASVTDEE